MNGCFAFLRKKKEIQSSNMFTKLLTDPGLIVNVNLNYHCRIFNFNVLKQNQANQLYISKLAI